MKDVSLSGSYLTPATLSFGFAAPSADILRIVRCHPAQAAQFKITMAELYANTHTVSFLDYAWQMSAEVPLDKVECWLFDGKQAVHVATIRDIAIPFPWNQT